jgi:hypothetical protein
MVVSLFVRARRRARVRDGVGDAVAGAGSA